MKKANEIFNLLEKANYLDEIGLYRNADIHTKRIIAQNNLTHNPYIVTRFLQNLRILSYAIRYKIKLDTSFDIAFTENCLKYYKTNPAFQKSVDDAIKRDGTLASEIFSMGRDFIASLIKGNSKFWEELKSSKNAFSAFTAWSTETKIPSAISNHFQNLIQSGKAMNVAERSIEIGQIQRVVNETNEALGRIGIDIRKYKTVGELKEAIEASKIPEATQKLILERFKNVVDGVPLKNGFVDSTFLIKNPDVGRLIAVDVAKTEAEKKAATNPELVKTMTDDLTKKFPEFLKRLGKNPAPEKIVELYAEKFGKYGLTEIPDLAEKITKLATKDPEEALKIVQDAAKSGKKVLPEVLEAAKNSEAVKKATKEAEEALVKTGLGKIIAEKCGSAIPLIGIGISVGALGFDFANVIENGFTPENIYDILTDTIALLGAICDTTLLLAPLGWALNAAALALAVGGFFVKGKMQAESAADKKYNDKQVSYEVNSIIQDMFDNGFIGAGNSASDFAKYMLNQKDVKKTQDSNKQTVPDWASYTTPQIIEYMNKWIENGGDRFSEIKDILSKPESLQALEMAISQRINKLKKTGDTSIKLVYNSLEDVKKKIDQVFSSNIYVGNTFKQSKPLKQIIQEFQNGMAPIMPDGQKWFSLVPMNLSDRDLLQWFNQHPNSNEWDK